MKTRMKFKSNIKKRYNAQGLIEAVMAVAIAGIACMVFLDIAARSISSVNDIENADQLIKTSADTAQKVRKIAEMQNSVTLSTTVIFPEPVTGNCYILNGDAQKPYFGNSLEPVCIEQEVVNNTCKSKSVVTAVDNVFSVYCITSVQNNLVMGKVYSGLKLCQTKGDSDECKVSNSVYSVAVYVEKDIRESAVPVPSPTPTPTPTPTSFCGDNICNGTETVATCLVDCPFVAPFCGDNICNGAETRFNCNLDCKFIQDSCGDLRCEPSKGESDLTCPIDCSIIM